MRFRTIAIITIIFFAALGIIGLFNAQNCSQIGACRNCWNDFSIQVASDLCPTKEPCIAAPYLQQHNAVVDTLLCACTNAKTSKYADASLSKQIEDAYFTMRGGCPEGVQAAFCADPQPDHVNAQDICDDPGQYLAKRTYG